MPGRFLDDIESVFTDYETYMRYAPKVSEQAKNKGFRCFYCGKEFDHEPLGKSVLVTFPAIGACGTGDGGEFFEDAAAWGWLCSQRCVWLDGMKWHKTEGMTEEAARKHLVEEHGLRPP